MTQKISPQKIFKMMALYFDGYSQSQIAEKLKINQATVSLSVGKFSTAVEQYGLEAAGKEYGIMDQVKALHSLAAELKEAKLTAEEAQVGLKMVKVFHHCGVKAEDYQDLVQACTKMKSEGYIDSAVKLNQLEKSMGMTPEEIIAQATSTSQQLKQTQAQLQNVTVKLNAVKEELVAIDTQKKKASQDLTTHMKQIGVDMNRLKLVETLAITLKEANIPDKEIQHFIQYQQLLSKDGIGLEIFMEILQQVKLATFHDGGKELLKTLTEYNGLFQAAKALQIKVEGLSKQVAGLEEQAKFKGKIEGEVVKLEAEKASLEAYIAGLHDQKNELDHIKSEVSLLTEKKANLEHEISELEVYGGSLADEIKSKEQKVSDLKDLELKHSALIQSLSEIEVKVKYDERRWKIFESFLGFVQSSSPLPELENFIEVLPGLLDSIKHGKFSPELLRRHILQQLAGPELQLLKCTSCQARIIIDKPPNMLGTYYCTCCGLSHTVVVDKDALAILKAALSAPKKQDLIVVQQVIPIHKKPKIENSKAG